MAALLYWYLLAYDRLLMAKLWHLHHQLAIKHEHCAHHVVSAKGPPLKAIIPTQR